MYNPVPTKEKQPMTKDEISTRMAEVTKDVIDYAIKSFVPSLNEATISSQQDTLIALTRERLAKEPPEVLIELAGPQVFKTAKQAIQIAMSLGPSLTADFCKFQQSLEAVRSVRE